MPYLFPIVGTVFSCIFIVVILLVLIRALRKNDISTLFLDEENLETKRISTTKFWQNVAYAAATVAFLGINLAVSSASAPIEVVWIIYLGVVASNAVMSKWIGAKYHYQENRDKKDRDLDYYKHQHPMPDMYNRRNMQDEFRKYNTPEKDVPAQKEKSPERKNQSGDEEGYVIASPDD